METPRKNKIRAIVAMCGTAVLLSTVPALAAPVEADVVAESLTETAAVEDGLDEMAEETTVQEETVEENSEAQEEETSVEEETESQEDDIDDPGSKETADDADDLDSETESVISDTYTAPENTSHVNVSFVFTNTSGGKPVYPVTIELKETDTKVKEKIVLRSAGQIVELEHGDYQVVSLKDSGKVPLVASDDTLSLYNNTSYTIRYAQNRAKKMFTDFLKDNILLVIMFAGAAALYNATIIKNFNKHPRR